MRSASDELRQRLEALDSRLFEARICAHAGDDALATELTKELAECVDLEQDDARARRLIHHLPVCARRIPAVDMAVVADKLDAGVCPPFSERYFHYRDGSMTHPSFPLGTIWVSFSSISVLKLHDIVVDVDDDSRRRRGQPPRPRGLGSAVLEHLCRSADRYGLAISGDIMPGDRTGQTSERLARCYERHGFTITQKSPGVYLWAKIRRKPKTGNS